MAAEPKPKFVDKDLINRLLAQHNARIGFVPPPDATPQKAREMMQAEGIRAEDNEFSCDLISMREE